MHFQSSNIMITNFKITERICRKHGTPEVFVCIAKNCTTHSLLCSTCAKKDHPHLQSIHSLPNFTNHFSHFVVQAQERAQIDRVHIPLAQVIKTKKQEVEQLHLQLIERLMKQLSDEKKAIWASLDLLQRQYREKESLLIKNHQRRLDILYYLLPYAQNKELLELKVMTSSGWALTRLKEHLNDLENLTNNYDKNAFAILESSLLTQASQKLQGTLFRALSKLLKESSLLMRPPMPEKVYKFNQRRGIERASSSGRKKCESAQSKSTKSHSLHQF